MNQQQNELRQRDQRIQELVFKYEKEHRDSLLNKDISLLAAAEKERLRHLEQVVSKQAKEISERDTEIRHLQCNLQAQSRLEPTVLFSHSMGNQWSGNYHQNKDVVDQLRQELDDASHQVCRFSI